MKSRSQTHGAFSLIELLLVIGIIAMLAAMLMPTFAKAQARSKRIQCVGNLKELGTAFNLFANDHHGQFPMQIPTTDGGTQEFTTSFSQFSANTYRHFQAISRDLSATKIVTCPMDKHLPAADWASLSNSNVSYFVWLSALPTVTVDPLAGDRNIGWTGVIPPDLKTLGDTCFWETNIHVSCGNIVFADTHVELLDNAKLSRAINAALQK